MFIFYYHRKKYQKKMVFFKIYFAKGIFFLFFGFLLGNLFGTFVPIFRRFIIWDVVIVALIILVEEFISYSIYKSKKRSLFFLFKNKKLYNSKKFIFLLNRITVLMNFLIANIWNISTFFKKKKFQNLCEFS